MNWLKQLRVCKNFKCFCICKNNTLVRTLRRLSTRPSFRFCKQTNHWIVAVPEYLQELAAETDWEDEKQLQRLIIKKSGN